MKRVTFTFLIASLLLCCGGCEQKDTSAWQSANKALLEGRITDAKNIIDKRISEIEKHKPNGVELAPYLKLQAAVYSIAGPTVEAKAKAQVPLQRILEIDNAAFGPVDSRSLYALIDLANMMDAGEQKEQLLIQGRDLALQNSRLDSATVIDVLRILGTFYSDEHRWSDAETTEAPALKICADEQRISSPCANLRSSLAQIYQATNRKAEAAQLIEESDKAEFYPRELRTLEDAAANYRAKGLYTQSEAKFREAASWIQAHPVWLNPYAGPERIIVWLGSEYTNVGEVLEKQCRFSEAEEEYKKAIAFDRDEDPRVTLMSAAFADLLKIYRKTGRLNEAEPIAQDILQTQKKLLGESSTFIAESEVVLASLYAEEAKYEQAEQAYEQAVKIYDTNTGPTSKQSVETLNAHAALLCKMRENGRAAAIMEKIQTRINPNGTPVKSECQPSLELVIKELPCIYLPPDINPPEQPAEGRNSQ